MKNFKIGIVSLLFIGLLAFPANSKELSLGIEGMTCEACINKVTDALMKIDGVEKVDIAKMER